MKKDRFSKENTIKKLKSLSLFLITVLFVPFIPILALVKFIGKRFNPDFLVLSECKPKNYIAKYLIDNWFSDRDKAQNNRVFVLFLFPALFAFVLFVVTPFIHGIYLSMTDWNGLNTGEETFIGLVNYKDLLTDVKFLFSFYRTILYSVLNILVINIVAFLLALLVTQKLKLKNIYRAGFFMPNLIGGLVLGYIWQFIFNRAVVTFGPAFETSLLLDGTTALIALIFVVTWQYAGYIMMIYIAALQNVPQDLIEASTIDGANAFQRLRNITLPLVAQAFTVAMFLTLVTSFKQFDTLVSLTSGGPATLMPQWFADLTGTTSNVAVQSTSLVAMNIYNSAFSGASIGALGIGQSKAVVFFAFLLIISLLQVYFNKRKEIEL
jgi:raffinose/stachyose/melibiose transport system permease protein